MSRNPAALEVNTTSSPSQINQETSKMPDAEPGPSSGCTRSIPCTAYKLRTSLPSPPPPPLPPPLPKEDDADAGDNVGPSGRDDFIDDI